MRSLVAPAVLVLLSCGGEEPAVAPAPDVAPDAAPDTTETDSWVAPDVAAAGPEVGVEDTLEGVHEDALEEEEDVSERDPPPDLPRLPWSAHVCDWPQYWPYHLASDAFPLLVHFMDPADEAVALDVLMLVEHAWELETGLWEFSEPLLDAAACGPDERFDVWLWEGQDAAWVEALEPEPATAHDDWRTTMVVDPWGTYGGDLLAPTLAHELNHACQAADDWWDAPLVFEATATFVEALAYPDDLAWTFVLEDFQAAPDWSLDRDDGYETWYMYGAALYLHYLLETWFGGDPAFAGQMWAGLRSPPGARDDPLLNEPDFEDALDVLLAEVGGPDRFVDTVAPFAQWRFAPPEPFDGYPVPVQEAPAKQAVVTVEPSPMVLGSGYVRVKGKVGAALTVTVDGDPAVAWSVTTLEGGPVDEPFTLGADGTRVLVVTALPLDPEAYDPDARTDDRYAIDLLLDYGG